MPQDADHNDYSQFTVAALEDELVRILSSKNTAEVLEQDGLCHWMYLIQAEALLYKINVYDPLPEFVIFTEDVPMELAKALDSLHTGTKDRVITNAVRRIYESVDPTYFHTNGIYGKVKWRFAS